jgi:hypothetical protein
MHHENNEFTFDHMICAPWKQFEFSNRNQTHSTGMPMKGYVKGTDVNFLIHKLKFWAQFVHNTLALQIPNFDALLGGCN